MHVVKNYVAHLETRKATVPKGIKADLAKQFTPPTGQDAKTWYKEFIGNFTNSDTYNLDSLSDMSLLLFELQEWTFDCYMDEKALYVSFILTAYQNSQLNKNQEMKDFIRFVKDQSDILSALGIEIAIPPAGNTGKIY